GIRDFHVTGVQTCALPISSDSFCLRSGNGIIPARIEGVTAPHPFRRHPAAPQRAMALEGLDRVFGAGRVETAIAPEHRADRIARSEERRVGKEETCSRSAR